MLTLAGAGRLEGMVEGRGTQVVMALLAVAVMEIASCGMMLLALDTKGATGAAGAAIGIGALAVLVPVLLQAGGIGAALGWRMAGMMMMTGMAVGVFGGMGSWVYASGAQADFEAKAAKQRAAEDAAEKLDKAAIDALPETARAKDLLPYLKPGTEWGVYTAAMSRLTRIPDFEEDLAGHLEGEGRFAAMRAFGFERLPIPEAVRPRCWRAAGAAAAEFRRELEAGKVPAENKGSAMMEFVKKLESQSAKGEEGFGENLEAVVAWARLARNVEIYKGGPLHMQAFLFAYGHQ